MSASPQSGMDHLPCGCFMGTVEVEGEPIFMFEPHALDCDVYLYVLAEAKRQGKDITTLDAS